MTLRNLFIAFLIAIAPLAAQPVSIRTTTMLDGKGGVLKNQEIIVEGGRIVSVADAKGRAGYDLQKFTVMPGWIDTHVHLNYYFDKQGRLASDKESSQQAL